LGTIIAKLSGFDHYDRKIIDSLIPVSCFMEPA